MVDFNKLLKRRGNTSSLRSRIQNDQKSYDDDRIWRYELSKDGTAEAVIRFLPWSEKDGDWVEDYCAKNNISEESTEGMLGEFWVTKINHGWKGFYSICHTMSDDEEIRQSCPVCNFNSEELAKTGMEFNKLPDGHPVKEAIRKRKRYIKHYANILVIKDKANPQNEGKVFIFEFGKTVLDAIKAKIDPQFEDDIACNPADILEGCNFKLKLYKRAGQVQYDRCGWEDSSPLAQSEEEMIKIMDQAHYLHGLIENVIEPVEKVEARLARALKKENIEYNRSKADASPVQDDIPDTPASPDIPDIEDTIEASAPQSDGILGSGEDDIFDEAALDELFSD